MSVNSRSVHGYETVERAETMSESSLRFTFNSLGSHPAFALSTFPPLLLKLHLIMN